MFRNTLTTTVPPKTAFARGLRKRMTPGEKALWKKLRSGQFHSSKFRRQVPIGPYVVDFLCVEKMLVLEVDGGSHFQPGAKERDVRRESYLRSKGLRVFRCSEQRAARDPEEVLYDLAVALGLIRD